MSIIDKSKFEELKASGMLPSPKGVALAVMQLAQRENTTHAELARTIKTDPALAGRIVKAANTANMHGRRPIASVPDALVVLGLNTVRSLALGFSLVANCRNGGCTRFNYDEFWSRSLVTALAVQAITVRSRAAPPEETFLLGLLSRIGCLALATVYPVEYATTLEKLGDQPFVELAAIERDQFAMDHNELTVALMADWGLPKVLVEPVFHHETPETGRYTEGSRAHVLVHSLAVASFIAEICLAPESARRAMLPNLFLLATRIGLDSEVATTIADHTLREWREWGRLLDVKTHEVGSLAALARAEDKAPDAKPGGGAPAAGAVAAAQPQASDPDAAQKLRFLVVDDDRSIQLLLKKLLSASGHIVHTASNGKEALAVAMETRPHLIITDWIMPEMDGVSFCRALRQTKIGRSVYLLLLTSMEAEARLVEAFEAGVDDYVVKPINPRVLTARLRAGQRTIRLQQEVEGDREEIRRFAAELAMTNRRLQQAALMDPLTEVPNRRYAMDRMQQEWSAADRNERPMACMVIDVDHFKSVNDTHGHDVGDTVLRRVAETLKHTARMQDVIARLGGEEFLVLCPNTDTAAAAQCAERLRQAVQQLRVPIGAGTLQVTISIGVAALDGEMLGPDAMIKAADQAVYAAKQSGRNRTCIYRPKSQPALGLAAIG
jgi:two-component system cell cycle response regulator